MKQSMVFGDEVSARGHKTHRKNPTLRKSVSDGYMAIGSRLLAVFIFGPMIFFPEICACPNPLCGKGIEWIAFLKCSDVHNSCWACATDKSPSNLCSLFDTFFEMNA